ncbi:hypothetical protein DJ018_00305 [Phenylobacterium deserti]|uniref:histidine kinase n=2 Tax=Phenylobacterium deserti TaxID=1914756 RepID=A0A328ASG7_9CAUL|nr:hypothetical protein DJ018_00305 [Phenylobacterium deserti]
MAVLLVALLGAATILIVHQVDAFRRAQNERQLQETGRALSLAMEGKLQSYQALLEGLGTSLALANEDWAEFDRQARRVAPGPDAWIVVGDREGRQLVNTRLPPGAALPTGPSPQIWQKLDRGEPRICDLTRGFIEPMILCVDVPVMRNGRAAYYLSVVFRPRQLDGLLAGRVLADRRLGSVIDRNGVVIWRNQQLDEFLGAPAPAPVWREMRRRPEGVITGVSLSGEPTVAAFTRSPLSGWTFVVGVPKADLVAPRQRALVLALAGASLFLLLGAAVGVAASGRVTRAIDHLNAAMHRIRDGAAPDYAPSGFKEIDDVGEALGSALAERDAVQERFRLAQEVGGIGAWEWDITRDEGHVSDSYKEMHGLAHIPGPLRLAQVLGVIHPEDLPGYQARLAAAKQRREPSANDYRVIRDDGSIRWIYAKGRPIFAPDGTLIRAIGVVIDLTERRETEERLELLMREVDHRANNLMAVVQGAVTLSHAPSAEALREIILGRIEALARAHQLLADSRWTGADLRRLVEEEVRPFTLGDGERISLHGASLPLAPAAAQGVAMALHELSTNAAKHGALSVPEGRVSVRWTVEGGVLRLVWSEAGGPPVRKPTRRGFGATVLERAVSGSVGGRTEIHWREEGLVCELALPLAPPDGAAAQVRAAQPV